MAYLGFDICSYPSDSAMQAWWSGTPFYFCGFYLGGPRYACGNPSPWLNKRTYLKNLGYGFLVLYVGYQAGDTSYLTSAQGIADAKDAVAKAQQAGFPTGTIIYLDVEQGGLLNPSFLTYIDAWINEINNNSSYRPGVYCSYSQTADQINNSIHVNCQFAIYNINIPPSPGCTTPSPAPDPTNSGVVYALDWQYAQNCLKTYNGVQLTVDLNTATTLNPSNG